MKTSLAIALTLAEISGRGPGPGLWERESMRMKGCTQERYTEDSFMMNRPDRKHKDTMEI